jgi:putative acetyltransferase
LGFAKAGTTICLMTQAASEAQIRRATAQDALSIATVLRQAFAEYEPLYTKEGYAATTPRADEILVRMNQGTIWVAVHNGQIVGAASVVPKPEGTYVRGMAVLPAARGLGIGRLLLDEAQRFATVHYSKRLFLSTTPFLHPAIRLYEVFGFERTNEGPHDLFGTPLFTMQKILCPADSAEECCEDNSMQQSRDEFGTPCSNENGVADRKA